MQLATMGPHGLGLKPRYEWCVAFNRTGATLQPGEVVMFDVKTADASTVGSNFTSIVGADNFAYANVITPTGTLAVGGIGGPTGGTNDSGFFFGVVEEAPDLAGATTGGYADDARVRLCVRGVCRAKMAASSGTTTGKLCFPADAVRTLSQTVVVGVKPIARLIDRATTIDTLAIVNFDGIDGFGAVWS